MPAWCCARPRGDNLTRDIEAQLRATFGALVCKTTIPASVKVGESHARFLPVVSYAPRSPAAKAFEQLTREVIRHGQSKHGSTARDDGKSDSSNGSNGRVRRRVQDDAAGENEGRGENGSMSAAAPKRRRRPAPTGKTKPCKLHLPETLHDRLWYTARARRTTVSAIAAKLLDQHLPEWELTQKVS